MLEVVHIVETNPDFISILLIKGGLTSSQNITSNSINLYFYFVFIKYRFSYSYLRQIRGPAAKLHNIRLRETTLIMRKATKNASV